MKTNQQYQVLLTGLNKVYAGQLVSYGSMVYRVMPFTIRQLHGDDVIRMLLVSSYSIPVKPGNHVDLMAVKYLFDVAEKINRCCGTPLAFDFDGTGVMISYNLHETGSRFH